MKDTSAETGFPGSPMNGTVVSPSETRPQPCGIPGCMATLVKVTPRSRRASLTTSKAPMLTPPEVSTRSTSPATADSRATSSTGSSATSPPSTGSAPACGDGGEQRRPVAVDELRGPGCHAWGHQFIACGEDQHPRPAQDGDADVPGGEQRGQLGGADALSCSHDHLAGGDIAAGRPDRRASCRGSRDGHERGPAVGVFDADNRLGALGDDPAGHDPDSPAGAHGGGRHDAGRDVTQHLENAGHIGDSYGVPIQRRGGKRRQITRRAQIVGHAEPDRVDSGQRHDAAQRAERKHIRQMPFHRLKGGRVGEHHLSRQRTEAALRRR